MTPDEVGKTRDAARERRRVANVQATRIERVSREQDAGAPIVHRDARRLMSWNGENIEHAVAEVERRGVGGPVCDREERADRGGVAPNERDVRAADELGIA